MHYTQLFRTLREAKGLTVEELSRVSDRHRNTVLNVEAGRKVKLKTISDLMAKMGYPAGSPEMMSMALLWLEATSGVTFSRPETEAAAQKAIANYGSGTRQAARRLHEAVTRAHLTTKEIDLLVFAARDPNVMTILDAVREYRLASSGDTPHLRVAEDK